jgi:hypothetical protein
MKTTIDIADGLLRKAKRIAAARNTTLRAVIEQALRESLQHEGRSSKNFELKSHTFKGRGLQAGLSWDDWGALRDLAYEGRGS